MHRDLHGKTSSSDRDIFVSAQGHWHYDEDWFANALSWTTTTEDEESKISVRYKYYFTIHAACVKILHTFFQYENKYPSQNSPKSLRDFIDASIARQEESRDLFRNLGAIGKQEDLPSSWASFQNVDYSHLYFGARRFWADPWDCEPGSEHLCASPINLPEAEDFISICLACEVPSQGCPRSKCFEQLRPSEVAPRSQNLLTHLPREVLDMIVSPLSVRDSLSILSSTPKLFHCIDGKFWRLHTLRLHGGWLWELQHYQPPSPTDNWKALLHVLTTSRTKLLREAGPYWIVASAGETAYIGSSSETDLVRSAPPLPLGLVNRQRIWMCLEFLGAKFEWEMDMLRQVPQ